MKDERLYGITDPKLERLVKQFVEGLLEYLRDLYEIKNQKQIRINEAAEILRDVEDMMKELPGKIFEQNEDLLERIRQFLYS